MICFLAELIRWLIERTLVKNVVLMSYICATLTTKFVFCAGFNFVSHSNIVVNMVVLLVGRLNGIPGINSVQAKFIFFSIDIDV